MINNIRVKIPFKSKTDEGTSFEGIGYISINNDIIVRQEVKLISATISTRNGTNNKKKTEAYLGFSKKLELRDVLLGESEFKPKNIRKEDFNSKSIELNRNQLIEVEDVINKNNKGTILSTLIGLLTYVNATGSDKKVSASPIVISNGIYEGYRFYNMFTNEFYCSSQVDTSNMHFDDVTIEEFLDSNKIYRNIFALYNYEKEQKYILDNFEIDSTKLKDQPYHLLLGDFTKVVNSKRSIEYLVDMYRTQFKKNVMNEAKYKLDFVYEDTNKENTEAAHIFEVHTIKKVKDTAEWDLIADVNNCLLLTPDVHKAWDRGQIQIKEDGSIINISMEPKRFERMFSITNYKLKYKLQQEQIKYLKMRYEM